MRRGEGDLGSEGTSSTTSDTEIREEEISYPANTQETQANNSNPRSMDSGIATRYGELVNS